MRLGEYLIERGWRANETGLLWSRPGLGNGVRAGEALQREWAHQREQELRALAERMAESPMALKALALLEAVAARKAQQRAAR
ncbi:MAG TPA: hypothetical protein VNQ79_06735 [Blastocatellia bacterium]|nr:hypothetical protein [Blastocatellia bacterium]